jgi:hypothetical protein
LFFGFTELRFATVRHSVPQLAVEEGVGIVFNNILLSELYWKWSGFLLFISFACPKETNQRKGQPQIFFGIFHFFGCPRNTTRRYAPQTVLLGEPIASQPQKCQSLSKKDLVALFALRRFGFSSYSF